MIRRQLLSTLFPYTTLFRSPRFKLIGLRRVSPAIFSHSAATPIDREFCAVNKTGGRWGSDRKSTRLNSSHQIISYAVFCLKKKNKYHSTLEPHKRKHQSKIK